MTERAAIRAKEGIWSRPAAHLGFREARISSHHSGVAGNRESMDMNEVYEEDGLEVEGGTGERDLVEELTDIKWSLRVLAIEA